MSNLSTIGFGFDCVYEYMYRTGIGLNASQDSNSQLSQPLPVARTIYDFSFEELLQYMSFRRPSIYKHEENDFFWVIIDWVCKDYSNRGRYIGELVSKMDLFRLSPAFVFAQFSNNPILIMNQQCIDIYISYVETVSANFVTRVEDTYNGINGSVGLTNSIGQVTSLMRQHSFEQDMLAQSASTHSHNTRKKFRTTNNSQQDFWGDVRATVDNGPSTSAQAAEHSALNSQRRRAKRKNTKRARNKKNRLTTTQADMKSISGLWNNNMEVPTTSSNSQLFAVLTSNMVSGEPESNRGVATEALKDEGIHTEAVNEEEILTEALSDMELHAEQVDDIKNPLESAIDRVNHAQPSSDSENDFISVRSNNSNDIEAIPMESRNTNFIDVLNVGYSPGPLLVFSTGTKARRNFYFTYNFQNQQCRLITDTSSRRFQSCFTMYRNFIMDIGGHSPQGSSTKMEIFDTTGIIAPGEQAFAWKTGPQMKFARTDFALVNDNGAVYVMGGINILVSKELLITMEKLQPGIEGRRFGKWQKLASMRIGRRNFGAAALNGQIYAVGGCDEHLEEMASVSKYDIETDTWSEVAPLNLGRKYVRVAALGNRIYAVGGWCGDGNVALNSVEVYDPEIDQWSFCADMSVARSPAGVAAANGKLYVFGGEGTDLNTIECYSPDFDSWETIPAPHEMACVLFHCVAVYQ